MKQSQPLRIERPDLACFTTSKTIKGLLWFVNNRPFEERVLGYFAKYQEEYSVVTYALNIQGNHIHTDSLFPKCNRSLFLRDFNARTAEAARALVPGFECGPLYDLASCCFHWRRVRSARDKVY